jgi:O-succinylbenzoic acid--CoA ligase
MMIVRSFVGELNLQMTEPRSIPEISMGSTIDFCAMVPLQVLNLLACIKDLHPINKLLVGGAEISNELEKLLLPITTEVFASYGMAETSSHVAIRRLNGPQRQKYYTALPGIKLSLDDRGCLVINASYLPGPVVSNDLVELTTPDSFIWIGRFDNLINSGGIKIAPEEVESLILSKTMLECVAVGLPHKKLGQKLVFVFEQDQIPDSFSDLKSDLDSFLPRHWRPKDLIVVRKFPRNESFKVDRRKLTAMLSE